MSMTIVPQHDATSCPIVRLDDGTWRCQVEIQNARGLHARAAARFVKLAEAFDADVTVSNRGQVVSGRSI
ncbi:MAG: HPr family phosphocarrier protein, partial [Bacteroidetes bacterium]|nr:HPr family phosphocarrier protein [Bacteroidota bacterium]